MTGPRTNTLVKKSFLQAIERGRDDPVKFAWDFLNVELHPGQEKFIRAVTKRGMREGYLAAANRYGKTEIISVLLLWSSFFQIRNPKFALNAADRLRPYTSINVSISLDQAAIGFDRAVGYAEASKRFAPFVHKIVGSPFPIMTLKDIDGTKAEIWARSTSHNGRYLLGQSFQFANFDEASLEPNLNTITQDVLLMRMADAGGLLTMTSQPRGKNDFYSRFLRGLPNSAVYDPAVYSQHGSSFDNPHIDHNYVRRAAENMTESQREENIYGRFSDQEQFFPMDRLAACYLEQHYRLPVLPNLDIVYKTRRSADGKAVEEEASYVPSKSKPIYVIGIDVASLRDQTCIVVLRVDVSPWQMVAFELLGRADWRIIKTRITHIHKQYGAWGLLDTTGAGHPVHEDLIDPDGPYRCEIEGFKFNPTSKLSLLYDLQATIQGREVVFPYNKDLVDSLASYQLKDDKLFTDPVFALALAVRAAKDIMARLRVDPIMTPDIPIVTARRDRATGQWIISDPDDDDDEFDGPNLERWLSVVG